MPAIARTPLGAASHTRKWYVDVAPVGSSSFIGVLGINNLTPNFDNPTVNDISDNDASGWKANQKDAATWSIQATLFRKVLPSDATSYDPGQELLRLTAIGKFGAENTLQVRIYEMEPSGPRVEAYLGIANVSWQNQAGGMEADDTVQVMLNGNGALAAIAHPDTGAAVPLVTGVSPAVASTGGGDLLILTGNRFTGTTGVTLGGTACTHVTVISDGKIACNTPAKSAGTYPVVVTNAAGPSTVSNPNVVVS